MTRGDGDAVGVWRLLARDLAHLLDTAALFVGWLWPLWDRRRRTFADLLLRTEVRRVEPAAARHAPADRGGACWRLRWCARPESRWDIWWCTGRSGRSTRPALQIAEQGPRIVEQMLSYDKDTLKDDFARAQSLATDGYRPQLVAQQEAVQKAGATTNEYWAVSSAVLSASTG